MMGRAIVSEGGMEMTSITDVPYVRVGHATNAVAETGCTVVTFGNGGVAGVDVRGAAPGTRETDLLDPMNTVEKVHAICLSGGSAYGLAAASGVMRALEEKGVGLDVGVAKVPIVPAAVIFDLAVGDASVRPDEQMGYEATQAALSTETRVGAIGAGTGATVGKLFGIERAMRGGLGTASKTLANGVVVGALVVVNAVGEVRNPKTNEILAGVRSEQQQNEPISIEHLFSIDEKMKALIGGNTTIGMIATNAKLTKAQAKKVAGFAQNAIARTIMPAHTMHDGDTMFAVSTGDEEMPIDIIGHFAREVMEEAIMIAVQATNAKG